MAVKRVVEAPLWAHVLALCVLLVAASWFVGVDGIVTVDEGSYSTQARAVAEGSWNVPWRFEAIDPTGEWYPFPGSSVGPRGFFPYARQPLFVTVLAGGWMAAGSFGMHLAPLAGYVLACLAAALVAGWAGPRARRWSFWICAASPLLVDGWILWGHSLVAAVAGFGLVALVARTDGARGRGWEVAALAGAACAGVIASLLRADGALVCLGLVAVAGCRWWPTGRWRALGAAAAVLLPSVGALLLQRIWIAAIVGGDGGAILSDRTGGSSWIGGRIKGAWYSLLEPVLRPARNDAALVVLGVAAVVLAGWAGWQLRDARGDATRRVVIALAVASLLTVGRLVLNDDELITGLFPAWPAAAFIVGALVRSRLPTQARLLVVYAAVVAIGIIATQYPDGGSLQWGGRFFSGLVVPLAALGAWIVSAAGAERERADRTSVRRAFAALVAAPVVVAMLVVASTHDASDRLINALGELEVTTIVTDLNTPARIAWRDERPAWVLVDPSELTSVAADVAALTGQPVAVLTLAGHEVGGQTTDITPRAISDLGGKVVLIAPSVDP